MIKSTLVECAGRAADAESVGPLTELLRTSVHRLLYQAVAAKTEAFVAGYEDISTWRTDASGSCALGIKPSGRYGPVLDRCGFGFPGCGRC